CDSVKRNDDREIDLNYAGLQETLYLLSREVNQLAEEEEAEDDLFGSLPSLSEVVSKGVEAVRGKPKPRPTRTSSSQAAWEELDDDDEDW
ncbi:MAG TPA: hypothetical protein V6D03_09340, partial [Candidatus Caenarcaniphilales bacterium]